MDITKKFFKSCVITSILGVILSLTSFFLIENHETLFLLSISTIIFIFLSIGFYIKIRNYKKNKL